MNPREISEEIGAVEQLLENIGETGNQRTDDLLRIAKARLGHANGHLVANLPAIESKIGKLAESTKGAERFFFGLNPATLQPYSPRAVTPDNHQPHEA
jgi:hypothetical protein